MPTFGLRPDDIVRDSRGDAMIDLKQTFYASRADAVAQVNPLGTATSKKDGTWRFAASSAGVFGRDPEGNIRFYDSEEPKLSGSTAGRLLGSEWESPLVVPTPDGNPSITHPFVLDAVAETGELWNGYRYWMSATPYPDASRENPCIYRSQNGTDWEMASDGPIFTLAQAQAAGLEFNSDGHLNLVDGVLHHIHRAYKSAGGVAANQRETFFHMTSTDGVTWSTPTVCFDNGGGDNDGNVSPAFVYNNGTWEMWAIDGSAATASKVRRRTSTDLVNWSAPVTCTIPSDIYTPWHLEVRRTPDGRYHLLLDADVTFDLYYWQSMDGLTWTGQGRVSDVVRSGRTFDSRGFYKSSFIPRPGGRFDVWVCGLDGSGGGNAWQDVMRMDYRPNLDLSNGDTRRVSDRVWVPATQLFPGHGTPNLGLLAGGERYVGMKFDPAAYETAVGSVWVPSAWRSWKVTLRWAKDSTGTETGNVVWKLFTQARGNNSVTTNELETSVSTTAATTSNQTIHQTVIQSSQALIPHMPYFIRLERTADNASDTLAVDAAVLGILFERLS